MTLVWHRDPLGRVWRRAETQAETANSERPGGGPRLTMVWNPQHVVQHALGSNQADEDPVQGDEQIPASQESSRLNQPRHRHARPAPVLSAEQRCLGHWRILTVKVLDTAAALTEQREHRSGPGAVARSG